MGNIKPHRNQTLIDIACQVYGGVEGIVWVLEDNPKNYIGDHIDNLQIRDNYIESKIAESIKNKDLKIVTNEELTERKSKYIFSYEFSDEFKKKHN